MKMITKKLNLKTKLKQFFLILLICCNEINFEMTKINSDYYNYATFTRNIHNNKTLERPLLHTTNLTISHDAVEQDSEVYFLKNICSRDLNKKDSTYDNCLITLMPCVNDFSKSFSTNFTDILLTPYYSYSSSHVCDFVEVTVYEPSTKYLTRKTITRKQFQQFKSAYMNDFKYSSYTQQQMNLSSQSSFAYKTVLSPNGASSDKLKFVYNIEADRIQDLNMIYRKYLNSPHSDDHLTSMSLIQDKYTYNFFLHLKTKSGKTYLNQLFPDSSLSNNNYYFRFKKPNTFLLRLKSLEYFNIIKYEIYTPITPLCAVELNVTRQEAFVTKNDHLPSDYLNCDNFDELAFYQEIQQREPFRKYKEVQTYIINENIYYNMFDPFKCILIEYFGKIFTCDGRILSAEEFGFFKSKNLKYYGILVLYHGKNLLLKMDSYGNIPEYKNAINTNLIPNSNTFMPNSQTCHECAKVDLRSKVENNNAYIQYKEAIKIRNEKYEKIVILFIIFIVLTVFWLKNNSKQY